jgi:hypothetical protein
MQGNGMTSSWPGLSGASGSSTASLLALGIWSAEGMPATMTSVMESSVSQGYLHQGWFLAYCTFALALAATVTLRAAPPRHVCHGCEERRHAPAHGRDLWIPC